MIKKVKQNPVNVYVFVILLVEIYKNCQRPTRFVSFVVASYHVHVPIKEIDLIISKV